MSGGSIKKAPSPHTTIGCQELLGTEDASHSGMLKKQLAYRRGSGKGTISSKINTFLKMLPWENRYVVLASGSLYHYKEPTSKKPTGCYSLYGYNQVVRAGDIAHSKQPWAFKVVHVSNDMFRVKYFCAGSEVEMKTWLREIRSQLVIANGSLISQSQMSIRSIIADEDIEKPVYSESEDLTVEVQKRLSEEDAESDDDDYLEIDEQKLGPQHDSLDRRSRPLPPPPGEGNVSRNPSRNQHDEPQRILNLMNESYGEADDISPNVSGWAKMPLPGKNSRSDSGSPPPGRRLSGEITVTKESSFSKKNLPVPPPPRARPVPKTPPEEENQPAPTRNNPVRFGVNVFGGMNNNEAPPTKPKPPPVGKKPPNLKSTSTSSEERSLPPTPNKPLPTPPPRYDRGQKTEALPQLSISKNESTYDIVDEHKPQAYSEAKELIRWNDVYWDGADKQACEQIIRNIGIEGVYMVRQSDRAGCVQTLVCFADAQIRKFMIKQDPEGQYFIKEEHHFSSIISLLDYYHQHNLPNKSTPLLEPFTKYTRDS